ncbi:MAG: DUF488 domain-containing protein [Rikenellaceae bacterium]|nr:DUF488 domain-containing protein [Rikenellaceae bacterium]
MKIYTIGVYNSTEQQFFSKLIDNNIDTFCDIRQRRGVRGSEYAFVNSNYLQTKLNELDIKYAHILDLAPTSEIREKQKIEDARLGVQKKSRDVLGSVFTREYKNKISSFDFDEFYDQLDRIGASRVVFFCVEEKFTACHRSIVAQEMKERFKLEVIHL